jgi:hypothetical protein
MTFVYAQPQLTIVALSNAQWPTSSCSALSRSLATSAIWRRRVGAGPIGLGLLGDMLRVQVGSKLSIEIGLDFESDHSSFVEFFDTDIPCWKLCGSVIRLPRLPANFGCFQTDRVSLRLWRRHTSASCDVPYISLLF